MDEEVVPPPQPEIRATARQTGIMGNCLVIGRVCLAGTRLHLFNCCVFIMFYPLRLFIKLLQEVLIHA